MSNSSFQRTPKEIITTLHRELVSLIVGVAATQLYLRDMTHPARSLSGRMRVGVQKRSDRVSCDPNSGSAAGSAQGWPLGCIIRLFTTMASANFGQPCDLCVQPKCCCDLCVNEYTAFCNGPGCQVSPSDRRAAESHASIRGYPRPSHYAPRSMCGCIGTRMPPCSRCRRRRARISTSL